MNNALSYGFGFLLLLGLLAGVCFAEQAPSYFVQIHGGEITIANDTDGMAIITVKDVDSTVNISNGNGSLEKSIDFLIDVPYPAAAALELSHAENKSVSMVNIENITISDDDKTVTLLVTPLPFYEGVALSEEANMSITLDELSNKTFTETRISSEIIMDTPSNAININPQCDTCMIGCCVYNDRPLCEIYCRPECS